MLVFYLEPGLCIICIEVCGLACVSSATVRTSAVLVFVVVRNASDLFPVYAITTYIVHKFVAVISTVVFKLSAIQS